MINSYTIDTAQQTILRRSAIGIADYSPKTLQRTADLFGPGVTPPQAVAQILASVRKEGDAAIRRWSKILDQVDLADIQVPAQALREAYQSLPEKLSGALQVASERIRRFHELQPLPNWETTALGGRLGQRATPVQRVGVYVPGGTAPLPSSLLMSVIPSRVAGVKEIIVCTPPNGCTHPHCTAR